MLGVSFFAAPYWPDRFGGTRARTAREWFITKGTELVDKFFKDSNDSIAVPNPIPPDEERPSEADSDVTEPVSDIIPAGDELPNEESAEQPESAALPPPEVRVPPLLPGAAESDVAEAETAEPNITVTEVQTPVTPEPSTAPPVASAEEPQAENAIRGSVTTPNARIRSVPDTSTNRNVVGWGNVGDRFTVLEEGSSSDGSKWYRIQYENGNKRGWISGSLVKLED